VVPVNVATWSSTSFCAGLPLGPDIRSNTDERGVIAAAFDEVLPGWRGVKSDPPVASGTGSGRHGGGPQSTAAPPLHRPHYAMGQREEEAMALFMQFFEGDGLTADVVRSSHEAEREAWEAQVVRCLRYWPGRGGSGRVFCLVEAPDSVTLRSVHRDACLPVPEITELFGDPHRWATVDQIDA